MNEVMSFMGLLPRWPLARRLEPEEALQREIVEILRRELSARGILVASIGAEIRVGGEMGPKLQALKSAMGAIAGMPDLIVIWPGGRALFMEVKRPAERRMVVVNGPEPGRGRLATRSVGGGQLSDDQRAFRDWALRHAVPWAVVRSVDEALAAVRAVETTGRGEPEKK